MHPETINTVDLKHFSNDHIFSYLLMDDDDILGVINSIIAHLCRNILMILNPKEVMKKRSNQSCEDTGTHFLPQSL